MLLFGKICYCGTVLNVLNFPYVYMFRCIGAPKTQKDITSITIVPYSRVPFRHCAV